MGPNSPEDERRRAFDAAFRLLAVRARSRGEIRDRLLRRGFSKADVESVIERLAEHNLLDDAAFARAWVEQRAGGKRPVGPARLAAELRQRQVEPEVARAALARIDPERELALAREVAVGRAGAYQDLPAPQARRKLSGVLRRRGFGWEVIRQVLAELLDESEEPGG